ncbi:MAG: acyltransferase [Prevotella sp.]|nr:acyltransferase [Prevotella sp.]
MEGRINWIDWGKTLAVILVVFCHLPQLQEWFYYRYLQACTITIFFFISGYLKKDRGSDKENWRKYWHDLILPYIIYNVLVYPYWFVRYYLLNGTMPDLFSALKPIIGALLFEHESSFAEPLNGPLWYLPAILFMHITIDLCRKTSHLHLMMIVLCIISFLLYAANKQWEFVHSMTPVGIFRRLPYYYIGYVMGRTGTFNKMNLRKDITGCLFFIPLSVLFFYWHLHELRTLPHVILFYPVNLCFLFGFIYGCELLSTYKTDIIVNISIGTLLIIGLHFPVIGIINYLTGKFCYQWYEALPTALLIIAGLYPLILLAKYHAPILIGKHSSSWNRIKE